MYVCMYMYNTKIMHQVELLRPWLGCSPRAGGYCQPLAQCCYLEGHPLSKLDTWKFLGKKSNVLKTMINHPPNHHVDRFVNHQEWGGFLIFYHIIPSISNPLIIWNMCLLSFLWVDIGGFRTHPPARAGTQFWHPLVLRTWGFRAFLQRLHLAVAEANPAKSNGFVH